MSIHIQTTLDAKKADVYSNAEIQDENKENEDLPASQNVSLL